MRYTTRQTTENLLRLISSGCKKVDTVHSQAEFQICSYALMALTTLSYENRAMQDFLAELDGLSTLLVPLQSDFSNIRQHASSCIGNAVKNHKENAIVVAELGVVDLFISLLSDDEENDVSKMVRPIIFVHCRLTYVATQVDEANILTKRMPAGISNPGPNGERCP